MARKKWHWKKKFCHLQKEKRKYGSNENEKYVFVYKKYSICKIDDFYLYKDKDWKKKALLGMDTGFGGGGRVLHTSPWEMY